MTAISETPANRNHQLRHNFRFWFRKLPTTNFFCTKVHAPGMIADYAVMPTPTMRLPLTGDHGSYEELVMEFLVDEDMKNWMEILNWMRGDTFPEGNYEYKKLEQMNNDPGQGLYADAILFVEDASKNPILSISYEWCLPIRLSGLDFDVSTTDAEPMTAQAVFKITTFRIDQII